MILLSEHTFLEEEEVSMTSSIIDAATEEY